MAFLPLYKHQNQFGAYIIAEAIKNGDNNESR